MPIYEFRCGACEAEFSALVSSHKAVVDVTCPSCAAPDPTRLLSTAAVQSKGSADAFGGMCDMPRGGGGHGGPCGSGCGCH